MQFRVLKSLAFHVHYSRVMCYGTLLLLVQHTYWIALIVATFTDD